MTIRKHLLFLFFIVLPLSGCTSLWEKDNTPPPAQLAHFTPTVRPHQAWDARISYAINHDNAKFTPVVYGDNLIIVSQSGDITCLNKNTGRTLWRTDVGAGVSSGIAVSDELLVVGTGNGDVIALRAGDRQPLWRAHTDSEVLATPRISSNLVIVKSIDGKISAFANSDGHLVWRHQEVEPNLILRGASSPQLAPGAVVVGYSNGKVQKLSLHDGHEIWTQSIAIPDGAFSIQRMIDIDADPIVNDDRVFATTYQGKVAGMNLGSGRVYWDHDITSYAGIVADDSRVYVSDAKSHVWAFDKRNGRVVWKQTQLEYRNITGPVLVGRYLVVGDGEGVLHWINTADGSFAGRAQVSGTAILTKPAVSNGVVYAITKDGYLTAYVVS